LRLLLASHLHCRVRSTECRLQPQATRLGARQHDSVHDFAQRARYAHSMTVSPHDFAQRARYAQLHRLGLSFVCFSADTKWPSHNGQGRSVVLHPPLPEDRAHQHRLLGGGACIPTAPSHRQPGELTDLGSP